MSLRRQVLAGFKSIHRARKTVFGEDSFAQEKARLKINEEFKKNKHVSNNSAISELLEYCKQVENELKTTVIQAKEVAPGKYEARLRKDTVKLDNIPFRECSN